MHTPSNLPGSADVCTDAGLAITAARIESVVSQCGEFATIGQIIADLGVNPNASTPAFEARIRTWLDRAGWVRVKKTINGVRVWGYSRPASNELLIAQNRDELLRAIATRPQPGQLLMPILIRRHYANGPTVELVNLHELQRDLALSLLSSDNSLNIASTSAALDELSTALASALALCKRSKAAMNSSSDPRGTSMDRSSFSRTSNASSVSLDSVSSMDFPQVLSKHSHGNAVSGACLIGAV